MVGRSVAETMLDTTATLEDVLYPPIDAYEAGTLQVTDLHTIAWEKTGNSEGIPVVVIHGGPGGGGQPAYRQYFDPEQFHIIQFDMSAEASWESTLDDMRIDPFSDRDTAARSFEIDYVRVGQVGAVPEPGSALLSGLAAGLLLLRRRR